METAAYIEELQCRLVGKIRTHGFPDKMCQRAVLGGNYVVTVIVSLSGASVVTSQRQKLVTLEAPDVVALEM